MEIRNVEYGKEEFRDRRVVSSIVMDFTGHYNDIAQGMVFELSAKLAANNVFEEIIHDPVDKKSSEHVVMIPLTVFSPPQAPWL